MKLDLEKHDYQEHDYQRFVAYVKGTWGSLFETDWKEDVSIEKIILSNESGNIQVAVFLKGNPVYYDIIDDELVEVAYDGKAIKTGYTLDSALILYIALKGTIFEDLGVPEDVEIISAYYDYSECDVNLSKELEHHEQSWAEDEYCRIHDL